MAALGNEYTDQPRTIYQYSDAPQKGSRGTGTGRCPLTSCSRRRSGLLGPPCLWGTCRVRDSRPHAPLPGSSPLLRWPGTGGSNRPFAFPEFPFPQLTPCPLERHSTHRCDTRLSSRRARLRSRLPRRPALTRPGSLSRVSPCSPGPPGEMGRFMSVLSPPAVWHMLETQQVMKTESHDLGRLQLSAARHTCAATCPSPAPFSCQC